MRYNVTPGSHGIGRFMSVARLDSGLATRLARCFDYVLVSSQTLAYFEVLAVTFFEKSTKDCVRR